MSEPRVRVHVSFHGVIVAGALVLSALLPRIVQAQTASTLPQDSSAVVTVRVRADAEGATAVESAIVQSGTLGAQTDARGEAAIRLPAGRRVIRAGKLGYRTDSALVMVRAGGDTTITIVLLAERVEVQGVIVTATRGERRVEDTPLRVEIIDEEEVAEKITMSPGDIAMMLNETGGLRVQTTNPSLGGANVRIQGLRGRYSLRAPRPRCMAVPHWAA